MLILQLLQPSSEKVQGQEKVTDYQHGVDRQLNQERAQRFCGFFFHSVPNASDRTAFMVACNFRKGQIPLRRIAISLIFQSHSTSIWRTRQTNIRRTLLENFTSTNNASTAICVAKRGRPTSNGTMTAVILSFTSRPKILKRKRFAKKRWKVVRSRRSATTARE